MPNSNKSVLRKFFPLLVCSVLTALLSLPASATVKNSFDTPIRIAYVPHPSLKIENGLASGSLSNLLECSVAYFSNIEFVEMPNYSLMTQSLENHVVDIAVNMAKSKQRDEIAEYAFDLYKTNILLVGNEQSKNNQGAGVLAIKKGSGMKSLLLAKGYQVNTQAYSIYRMIEMYREGLINSFVGPEVVLFDSLQAMDIDEIDYDYQVLAEYTSGAYVSKHFLKKHPSVLADWEKVAQACALHTPKIDP